MVNNFSIKANWSVGLNAKVGWINVALQDVNVSFRSGSLLVMSGNVGQQDSSDAGCLAVSRKVRAFTYLCKVLKRTNMDVRDTNGAALAEGDSVKLTKDLKVKGASTILKRGTVVKNIRLTLDAEEIEGRIEKTMLVLKTMFLQKV